MDETGQVEVVRHREQRPGRILDEADVVIGEEREIGVADHVFEQHHRVQRLGIEVLELRPRQFDDTAAHAAGDVVVVLDEEGVARRDRLVRLVVDVGGAREAGAERARRHQVEQRIGEVLAQRVLLVGLVVLAMSAELERGLAVEHGAGDFVGGEFHAQRHEGAVAGHAAEMAARAELHLDGLLAPPVVRDRDDARIPRRALGAAILVDGFEVGGQRKRERVSLVEQRPLFRFGAARQEHGGLGPRLGELQIGVLLGRRGGSLFLGDWSCGGSADERERQR